MNIRNTLELCEGELSSYEEWCLRTPPPDNWNPNIPQWHHTRKLNLISLLNVATLRHLFHDPRHPEQWNIYSRNDGMPYRDTLDLLEKNPGYFNSIHHLKDCGTRPHRRVFVFSQPRCGSTLLMRMMAGACLTNMIGDKYKLFYEGVLNIWEEATKNEGHYMVSAVEKEDEHFFPDEYRGYESRERELWNVKNSLATMIFGRFMGSGYAKSCTLGFGNQLVKPMADMLRHAWDDIDDLRIVWLTRPHEEIIESLQAKDKATGLNLYPNEKICYLKDCLAEQERQFKEAFEFGDIRITYNDLITNPEDVLSSKKLNPLYPPNEKALYKILHNKIK